MKGACGRMVVYMICDHVEIVTDRSLLDITGSISIPALLKMTSTFIQHVG